jgi:hypothetical protein
MSEESPDDMAKERALTAPHRPQPLDIPSIAKSLNEVYKAGSIPLVLIFIAAVVIFGLLVKGVLQTLPWVVYLLGFLIASGIIVFLVLNWLAYRRWRDEVDTRLKNRRMEMDFYVRLSSSNSELQNSFLLSLVKYTAELATREGSTPEGRRTEIKFMAESLGALVKEFVAIRGQLQLPELTSALPQDTKSQIAPGGQ